MFEGIKNFYNNFNESLSNTLSERMLKSGKSDFTIWDGYKAFFEESFDVSNKAVFDPMKKPIKDAAKVLDAYINDGDDTNITVAESLWNAVKGFGKMADKMVSAEDLVTASGVVLTGSAALSALPELVVEVMEKLLIAVASWSATILGGKGAYDTLTAETLEEEQKGFAEMCSEVMIKYLLP